MILKLKHSLEKIIKIWAMFGGILLMGAVLVTMINVAGFSANFITRPFGVFVPGLSGFEDMVTLWVGTVALSFLPYCQLKGGHISVDVLMRNAPQFFQNLIANLSAILMCLVALFLAYMLTFGMLEAKSDGTVTAVLGWPVWVYMAPGIVSCLLWGVAALMSLQLMQSKSQVGTV